MEIHGHIEDGFREFAKDYECQFCQTPYTLEAHEADDFECETCVGRIKNEN